MVHDKLFPDLFQELGNGEVKCRRLQGSFDRYGKSFRYLTVQNIKQYHFHVSDRIHLLCFSVSQFIDLSQIRLLWVYRVIINTNKNPNLIITVYRTSKIEKYS